MAARDPAASLPRSRAPGLAYFAAGLTLAVVALMVLGAMVRAHGAGLACPDWPLCFGQLIPSFDLRVAFEYSHRVFAACISLGLAGLSAALWRRPDLWSRVRTSLALCWGLLVAQVVLGGLTVLLLLAPWTVTAHLLCGTAFAAALLWTTCTLFESEPARAASPLPGRGLSVASALACALLVLQLFLGGLVSSQGAGLACPEVPWCSEAGWIPAWGGLAGLHMLHRANGLLLIAAIAWLWTQARSDARCARLSWIALRLALLQGGVGALNVVARLPVEITALHSLLATSIALTLLLVVRELFARRAVASRSPVAAPLAPGTPGADAFR